MPSDRRLSLALAALLLCGDAATAQELREIGRPPPSGSQNPVLPPPSGSQYPVLPPPSGYRYAPGVGGAWGEERPRRRVAPRRITPPAAKWE